MKDELKRIYRCIWFDFTDNVNREDMWVNEFELMLAKYKDIVVHEARKELLDEQAKARWEKLNDTKEAVQP